MSLRSAALWPVVVLGAAGLVSWNAQPFRSLGMHVRTKELAFLPSPALGRVLSLGQCAAASKLRWIDSFSYFELQLDRRDDRIAATGESGFRRLYDLVIAMDPGWEPFYQHAAFNTGALIQRHDLALGYLLRGLIELPHSTDLYRQAAAELFVNFHWEETQPEAMHAFLGQWAEAESTENGRRLVYDWISAMGKRRFHGLEQLGYWQDRLDASVPGSPTAVFLERTIRDLLARTAVTDLTKLVTAYTTEHQAPPLHLQDVLEPAILTTLEPVDYGHWGPIIRTTSGWQLRCDPFGFPFRLREGAVMSEGLERLQWDRRLGYVNDRIAAQAAAHGRWPETLADLQDLGVALAPLPEGGTYRLHKHVLQIDWDAAPFPPWEIRRR